MIPKIALCLWAFSASELPYIETNGTSHKLFHVHLSRKPLLVTKYWRRLSMPMQLIFEQICVSVFRERFLAPSSKFSLFMKFNYFIIYLEEVKLVLFRLNWSQIDIVLFFFWLSNLMTLPEERFLWPGHFVPIHFMFLR